MNRKELEQAMILIWAGYEERSEAINAQWWAVFNEMPARLFAKAGIRAVAKGFYGVPRPADIFREARKIIEEGLSKNRAITNEIYKAAKEEIELQSDFNPAMQFKNPEDLHNYQYWSNKKDEDKLEELYKEKLEIFIQDILKGANVSDAAQLACHGKRQQVLSSDEKFLLEFSKIKTIEKRG